MRLDDRPSLFVPLQYADAGERAFYEESFESFHDLEEMDDAIDDASFADAGLPAAGSYLVEAMGQQRGGAPFTEGGPGVPGEGGLPSRRARPMSARVGGKRGGARGSAAASVASEGGEWSGVEG